MQSEEIKKRDNTHYNFYTSSSYQTNYIQFSIN